MYKIIAKQDYVDKRPELIQEYNEGNGTVEYNYEGNANIKANDTYLINDDIRADEIKKSGLAEVTEIKLEDKKEGIETEKDIEEDKPKKNTARRGRKKKEE